MEKRLSTFGLKKSNNKKELHALRYIRFISLVTLRKSRRMTKLLIKTREEIGWFPSQFKPKRRQMKKGRGSLVDGCIVSSICSGIFSIVFRRRKNSELRNRRFPKSSTNSGGNNWLTKACCQHQEIRPETGH